MQRPNIIFIVADDLGFADLGCYGGRDAKFGKVSPVIDALAANGLRFSDGYSNSPVCSPTRFGLMTARYQYRLRGAAEEPINSRAKTSTTLGLPTSHPTLPSLLKAQGYRTALIGKWHLGYPPAFGPLRSGYDEFFGPMAGGVDYFTHCASTGDHDLWVGEETQPHEGYLTDLISRKSVDFVKRMTATPEQPFFLSMHYTAPHWPWETRDDHAVADRIKDNIFHLQGGNIHTYHRMIHHMDEGIGWVVDALKAAGQLDNTLIVFTSDNGGERFSDNWPLVGGKMDLTEGGIRVPWIAHWPQGIGGGQAHPEYPFDGVSLAPILKSPDATFDRPMYWRMNHRGQRALRAGDWKYLRVDGTDYLFNIVQDARERANLAKQEPDRLAAMKAQWEAWHDTMPPIPEDATISLGFSTKDMPQR
ncbi:MAG: twin-arginine translocation pathway signal protein [Betaproteobacteria bacterium]|nr:twin-arginine translocation pathway signal protein [Betaproteobacteria bacterium]